MTAAGVPSNSITYTCLIEAAVLSGDVDMAQRVFARAMATGVTNSVQVGDAVCTGCHASGLTGLLANIAAELWRERHTLHLAGNKLGQ